MIITFELCIQGSQLTADLHEAIERRLGQSIRSSPQPQLVVDNESCYTIKVETNGQSPWDIARNLEELPEVIDAYPDLPIRNAISPPELSIDDSILPDSFRWNHDLSRFSEIDITPYRDTLKKTNICLLDTGYTDHPEIAGIDHPNGKNFSEPGQPPLDPLDEGLGLFPGHGTSVAAIIIGSPTPSQLDKNDGVLPDVNVVPYRISSSVIHFIKNTIPAAVTEAIRHAYPILSMSMGGAPPRRSWHLAARHAYENGAIWICAAGNSTPFLVWPAAYPETIAATACDWRKRPWAETSYGPEADIAAPGHQVFIPYLDQKRFYYRFSSGSSFATAHIAAAAALWRAHHHRDLAPFDGTWRVTEAFRYCLQKSAIVPGDWDASRFGVGILDVKKLLEIPLPKPESLKSAPSLPNMASQSIEEKELLHLTWYTPRHKENK